MRGLLTAGAAAAALALGGCGGLEQLVKAGNDLDPNCGKDVQAKFATVFVFGWPIPILTEGSYKKTCTETLPDGATPIVAGRPLLGAAIPASPAPAEVDAAIETLRRATEPPR